jgi:hypothetical protein
MFAAFLALMFTPLFSKRVLQEEEWGPLPYALFMSVITILVISITRDNPGNDIEVLFIGYGVLGSGLLLLMFYRLQAAMKRYDQQTRRTAFALHIHGTVFGRHFDGFNRGAKILLAVHSAAFVVFLAVMQGSANNLITLSGMGLLLAGLAYWMLMIIEIRIKHPVDLRRREFGIGEVVVTTLAHIGTWGSLFCFIAAVSAIIYRFG